MSTLVIEAPFQATERQQELADAWYGPARQVLACGAIRSAKTTAAARLFVESALEQPSTYLVARLTYRELADTTQRAILDGDGGLPPLLPAEAIAEHRRSDNLVKLRNGSTILFRSLDEPAKLLNLTLGGIMIDQIEELDEGIKGERLYDTLLGRLSDPGGPRKLFGVANPGPTTHWLYRRYVDPRTTDPRSAYVHFRLTDNPYLPSEYVADMLATQETRPHWYRTYVLGEWGAFEGAAFPEFDEQIHVVPVFALPDEWLRAEGMDHGSNNPTAWLLAATDFDRNLLVWDEYYQPGLVSAHATEILRRREHRGWWAKQGAGDYAPVYADPSIKNRYGVSDVNGRELSVEIEYSDHGIGFVPGQTDRRAGYARLLELIHPDPARVFPAWHPRAGEPGSPRLFVTARCQHVIEQLRSASVKAEGKDALDVIDPDWASQHGHCIDSLRYLCMGRQGASPTPPRAEASDPRQAYIDRMLQGEFDGDQDGEELSLA